MPGPKRKKGERMEHFRSRLIRHYVKEGYPGKQAAAIAYRMTERQRKRAKR